MACLGDGGVSTLLWGSLGKACQGGAEGDVKSLCSAAVWDRDGNKCVGVGLVLRGAGRGAQLGSRTISPLVCDVWRSRPKRRKSPFPPGLQRPLDRFPKSSSLPIDSGPKGKMVWTLLAEQVPQGTVSVCLSRQSFLLQPNKSFSFFFSYQGAKQHVHSIRALHSSAPMQEPSLGDPSWRTEKLWFAVLLASHPSPPSSQPLLPLLFNSSITIAWSDFKRQSTMQGVCRLVLLLISWMATCNYNHAEAMLSTLSYYPRKMIISILKFPNTQKLWYIINLFFPWLLHLKTKAHRTESFLVLRVRGRRGCVPARILWRSLQWDPSGKIGDSSRKAQVGKPLRYLGDKEGGSRVLPWEIRVHAVSNDLSPGHC